MFYEKDTVMRIVRRIGEAWALLMGLLDDREARQALDRYYLDLCGLGRADAELLEVQSLAELLPDDKLMALGELTFARAERFASGMDSDTLYALRMRALMLVCALRDPDLAKLRLARAISLMDLTRGPYEAGQAVALLGFLSRAEAYDKAEDLLFDQLETWAPGELPPELPQAGAAFYAELRTLPDAQLELGGLPRPELDAGEAALAKYLVN